MSHTVKPARLVQPLSYAIRDPRGLVVGYARDRDTARLFAEAGSMYGVLQAALEYLDGQGRLPTIVQEEIKRAVERARPANRAG